MSSGMRFPLFREALLFVFLSTGASPICAGEIATESFEGYPTGRLKNSSRGAWESSTQAKVAEDSGLAKAGGKYLEIKTNSGTQKAERVFPDVPESGVFWLDFWVYNGFTPKSLEGSETSPCIRLGNDADFFLGVIFRPRQTHIEVVAKEQEGVAARFYSTEIQYAEPAWRRITLRIDPSKGRADVYVDGRKAVSDVAIGGYEGALSKLDIRGGLPVETDSLRIDEIGFYNEDPIKK